MSPASTGRLIINKTAVKNMDQLYRGRNRKELTTERLLDFNKVTIKLMDPKSELNPTRCREKNIISMEE